MDIREGIAYSRQHVDARTLDLFLPDSQANGCGILWIHGGGWRAGARAGWHEVAKHFCQHGFACASIDYRLAPAWPFPAQIEDVRLALRYLRSRADDLGFAPDRIAAAGSSAGGHLAALVATVGPEDPLGLTPELALRDTRPNAAICYCPVTYMRRFIDPSAELLSAVTDLMGATPEEAPALYLEASPCERIDGSEPPFLFLHGDADTTVPLEHSTEMARRLQAAGGNARVVVLPGVGHGFGYGVTTPAQQDSVREVGAFLQGVFAL